MTQPIVTATKGYAMLTQDQWIAEVQRLEGLVASLTVERDTARALVVKSGYFQSLADDGSEFVHVLEFCDHSGVRTTVTEWAGPPTTFCDDCGAEVETDPPPDRPSAYDMPVGSVVVTERDLYKRVNTEPGGWERAHRSNQSAFTSNTGIQSGWIEGLFSDGLVTEWRLP